MTYLLQQCLPGTSGEIRCAVCIQARIAQKDEALARYQRLLEQARAEMTELQRCHNDEMQLLQQQMHEKSEAALKKYCSAVKESLNTPDIPVATNEQVVLYCIVSDIAIPLFVYIFDVWFNFSRYYMWQ